MYSKIRSGVCVGIEGREVIVETDISKGLPSISVVGLASATVMESKERIKSAIINSGYPYPRTRITINLMPAELRKDSSSLDLPMAMGILCSSLMLDTDFMTDAAVIGELTLDGRVSEVRGALPVLIKMKSKGVKKVIIPVGNSNDAIVAGIEEIFPVSDLKECMGVIIMPDNARKCSGRDKNKIINLSVKKYQGTESDLDFSDIGGQENAKRAVMIATAGRHGLLMIGSPGCGKTMLASRMPGIMPSMSNKELIETAVIKSISGAGLELSFKRPFRHPHHTIGRAGLLGGGSGAAVPGEITLAHNGVLFLDEICEFDRNIIDGLRIPLEEKSITHFRKGEAYKFPCDFQLVMASNPCPCGYYGDREKECTCTQADIDRYRNKLSGPIMDRIDMKISMERVTYSQLTNADRGMSTEDMKNGVSRAGEFARKMGRKGYNCDLTVAETDKYCRLGKKEKEFMREAYSALSMSPRAYIRTLRVSRTIADISQSEKIREEHLAEALSYRMS